VRDRRVGPSTGRRADGDGGQVGGIEVLPFGFLVLVAGTLVIATVWAVVDTRFAVAAAAREAARAAAESSSAAEAAGAAHRRALETMAAFGRGGPGTEIAPIRVDGRFGRCARITATVSHELPAVFVPFVGGLGRLPPVEASHTELVDPFRSGIDGPAAC
jgi:hypothetical protein